MLAFKVTGVSGSEASATSWIKILEGESFPVIQAIREGDPNTEPLFAMLAERSAAVA